MYQGKEPHKRAVVFDIFYMESNIEYRTRNNECRRIKDNRIFEPMSKLEPLIHENNELISIFVTSVKTAKQKEDKKTS